MGRGVIAAAILVLVAGCGGGDDTDAPAESAPAPAPAAVALTPADIAKGCRRHLPDNPANAPAGLVSPAALVVGHTSGDAGIQRITGYIDSQPGPFVAAMESRPDLTVLFSENEGFDAEVNVQSGTTQVFWSLKKVCDTGSTFTAIVTTPAG